MNRVSGSEESSTFTLVGRVGHIMKDLGNNMKGFLGVVSACAVLVGPLMAQEAGYRAIDFEAMDINNDGDVDRNEWIQYFKDDIAQRDLMHPETQPLSFTIETAEGPKTVYFRPIKTIETPSGMSSQDWAKQVMEERAERQSAQGQARRLQNKAGRSRGPMPSFEAFDMNRDQKIARDEMSRQIPYVPERARN